MNARFIGYAHSVEDDSEGYAYFTTQQRAGTATRYVRAKVENDKVLIGDYIEFELVTDMLLDAKALSMAIPDFICTNNIEFTPFKQSVLDSFFDSDVEAVA